MTSKEVVIVRKEFYNPMLSSEIIAASKSWLGSVFKGRVPYRPELTKKELEMFMAHIDVEPDDRNKSKVISEWWADLQILVETGGYPLDISTYDDGTPVNMEHWILWKWASDHPEVAATEEEMLGNVGYKYYLRDPGVELKRTADKAGLLRQAHVKFADILKNKKSEVAMRRIVQMMNMDPAGMSKENLEVTIDQFLANTPASFLKLVDDKDLPLKASILDMVNLDILSRNGNHFVYIDKPIGNNIDQTVLWFKDAVNSGDVNLINAQYEDKVKERDAMIKANS